MTEIIEESLTGHNSVKPENPNQPESVAKSVTDYRSRVNKILNTPLSAENIDDYADGALHQLIYLINKAKIEYSTSHPQGLATDRDLEDTVFRHFGLTGIGQILTHIQNKSHELKEIDKLISKAVEVPRVIIPPDPTGTSIEPGSGEFKIKPLIPRLKSTLFVLANEFGVDINDPQQLTLQSGILPENTMRRTSYSLIDIPKLDRIVLICDEEGNVSYIFDSKLLKSATGKTSLELANLSKEGLNLILKDHPDIGQRLVYSSKFVPNMVRAIKTPSSLVQYTKPEVSVSLLVPSAPEGFLSVTKISQELGVSHKTVADAIESLDETLGSIQKAKLRSGVTNVYSPEQQTIIRLQLETQGSLSGSPPEGFLSVHALAKKFGVSDKVVVMAMRSLGEDLGPPTQAKLRKITNTYSLQQQTIIQRWLESRGTLKSPPLTDSLSADGLAKRLGVSWRTVIHAIESLGETLGPIQKAKFGSNVASAYTPEQQKIIEQYLTTKGLSPPPEDFLSSSALAKRFQVGYATVARAIKSLGEELRITQANIRGKVRAAYSPQQQETIRRRLESKGVLANLPTEGFSSAPKLAKSLGVSWRTVADAIKSLGDDLGDATIAKLHTKVGKVYSPQQQEMIRRYIAEHHK